MKTIKFKIFTQGTSCTVSISAPDNGNFWAVCRERIEKRFNLQVVKFNAAGRTATLEA